MTQRKLIQRATTGDRGPPDSDVEIHTTEQLGPKMRKTPNGNLLCLDVPIARVGWMIYGPDETPIQVDPQTGYARVYRSAEELFSPETIGSFMGSAVVDEHPDEDVTPENWKELSHGFSTTNVRRGEGEDADILLADLIITNEELIKSILDGKREVSCGYDADYETTGVGEGKQTNIIGNHIALVEKGRCGPRCAIGDRAYQRKEIEMVKRVTLKTADRLSRVRKMVKDMQSLMDQESQQGETEEETQDEEGASVSPGEGGATHIHIHASGGKIPDAAGQQDYRSQDENEEDPYEARFQALEGQHKTIIDAVSALTAKVDELMGMERSEQVEEQEEVHDEAGPAGETIEEGPNSMEEDPEKGKTRDSANLQNIYSATLAKAEVLVPGFRMATFDSKTPRGKTLDALCGARRKALDMAYTTNDGKVLIDSISGVPSLDLAKMTCQDVTALFNAASGAKKLMNNRTATGDAQRVPSPPSANQGTGPRSLADLNKANAEYWAKQTAAV